MNYYCTRVLPNLNEAIMLEDGESLKLETMKCMAEVTSHLNQLDPPAIASSMTTVYANLLVCTN